MVLTTMISVKIVSANINHYLKLGYSVNIGQSILVKYIDLPKNSNIEIEVKCDICSTIKKSSNNAYNRYLSKSPDMKYRCNKCNVELKRHTNLVKYGDKNYTNRNKYMNTLFERYGGHYNKLIEFKDKIKFTCISKYGVYHPMKNKLIKNKQQNTIKEKFGTNIFQSDYFLDKTVKTMNDRYGVTYSMQSKQISDKIKISSKKTKIEKILNKDPNIVKIDYDANLYHVFCESCHREFEISPHMYTMRNISNSKLCTICNKIDRHTSGIEIKFTEEIKRIYEGKIILNSRNVISPYEIDIYIPDLKLAFEFNGIYWHSELYKDSDYHKIKSDRCLSDGIQLLHIWEDDWIYKQDIIKSIIINKLGKIQNKIGARKCKIKEIRDNKLIKCFLDENHIQGFIGSKIKLGLFYNGELVSLMTFGNLRKSLGQFAKEGSYEMLRFCNKLNTSVIGGASKLFKYFIKNYEVKKIISYSDNSRGQGNLYKQLRFNFVHETDTNYYWIIDGVRKHRFNFRKDKLVKEGADPNKTEIQIMSEKGYYRIFDCGSKKWIYVVN
jgi:hypothetical protein